MGILYETLKNGVQVKPLIGNNTFIKLFHLTRLYKLKARVYDFLNYSKFTRTRLAQTCELKRYGRTNSIPIRRFACNMIRKNLMA